MHFNKIKLRLAKILLLWKQASSTAIEFVIQEKIISDLSLGAHYGIH